jgi:PAS domain S-box-containing protein
MLLKEIHHREPAKREVSAKGARAPRVLIAEDEGMTLRLYERALAASGVGVTISDAAPPAGRTVYCNPAAERITGYAAEEMIGNRSEEFMGRVPGGEGGHKRQRKPLAGGGGEVGPFLFRRKDRSVYWGKVSTAPMLDGAGQTTHHITMIEDVTAQVEAERTIREQAALLDVAREAIFTCDMEAKITYWNRGAEALYGWSAADACGKSAFSLNCRVAKEHCDSVLAELRATGKWQGELLQRTRNGRELLCQSSMTLMADPDGKPFHILAINSDLTEKKAIEARLQHAQRLESIGLLAGGLAHDLNNALAPLVMGIEVIKSRDKTHASLELLELMEASARWGADIVRQLMHFARGGEGVRTVMEPAPIIRETERIIARTILDRIRMRSSIPDDLWKIAADPTQVRQILQNLCVNSRDAMPKGGEISLSAENIEIDEPYVALVPEARPGRFVAIEVRDTGCGIAPELMGRIFDPFFSTKPQDKGAGLGLFNVYTITKVHGGFLRVESEVGRGSSFRVFFPASDESCAAAAPVPESDGFRGRGETILLVDDEAIFRNTTRKVLEHLGFAVITASDGAEGIVEFMKHRDRIRAVIADIDMPRLNGVDMAFTLLEHRKRLGVILISGFKDPARETELRERGIRAFIEKPYTTAALMKVLKGILTDGNSSDKGSDLR